MVSQTGLVLLAIRHDPVSSKHGCWGTLTPFLLMADNKVVIVNFSISCHREAICPYSLAEIQGLEPIIRHLDKPKMKKQSFLPTYSEEISNDNSTNEDL